MADVFLAFFQSFLPEELASSLSEHLQSLESGNFESILRSDLTRVLLGHQTEEATKDISIQNYNVWSDFIFRRLSALLEQNSESAEHDHFRHHFFFVLALASLYSFVQTNVTGPPLPFSSTKTIFTDDVASDPAKLSQTRQQLIQSLSVDGEGAYRLTPTPELFCLADTILSSPAIAQAIPATPFRWVKLRLDFLHQRLLSDVAPSLQSSIYAELAELEKELLAPSVPAEVRVHFLLERAAVHTHHGFDKKAREDLERAKVERRFEFALTGLLGKRTKFQEKETSQLVVLAKSAESGAAVDESESKGKGKAVAVVEDEQKTTQPKNLDLNDDTLLESISFSEQQPAQSSTDVLGEDALPQALAELDASNQPMLDPLDSVILLLLASSITNTNPDNGLTREETVPYATRVLEGGSSNWQVYTQALLVRSRIEGYRPRTMERGLLQLQAVVDQVIADTTSTDSIPNGSAAEGGATTFLPKGKEDESAPVSERLRFVFALCSPSRWELESELAERWVKLGGLRTALEIFERLEMWAEAALCWAATEREDKARKMVRKQLFHATNGDDEAAGEDEKWEGAPREPVPTDAPRLYCILGDIDKDPIMYEKAWEVSGNRYARAQRSLGRFWMHANDVVKAADAYRKSLRVNQLNHQSWFALGCAYLEMAQFERAVEAFTRVVQLDDQDAEAWSNLAAALLRLEPSVTVSDDVEEPAPKLADEEEDDDPSAINLVAPRRDPQQHIRDALKALKHAARLKHDNHRIWDNLLTVAASLNPPAFTELLSAQRRLIELRGATDGEACVDATILDALARHVVATHDDGFDPTKPGLARMLVKLVDEAVVPLITASAPLWRVVARLALWRGRPSAALDAHEKAWRALTAQPGWETTTEDRWNEVVEATVELVDAYETLGPREKTEGLAAGSGALVAKDWKFKARTAVKGVCGRARDVWEGTEGWERLRGRLEDLKG
ncbi:hypothetical protein BKA81DRAFT_384437 [Phyllosticta paracitricarpa]|uniref:TPR-like protein n=1 Tax=Phyllosticta paracitricarpa TaxID=2016321 RepID=A0ABR1N8X4_9PEZI